MNHKRQTVPAQDTPAPQPPPNAGAAAPACDAVLPLPRKVSGTRWAARLGAWAGVLALLAATIYYDIPVSRWLAARLKVLPKTVVFSLRDFGQVVPVVVVTFCLAVYDRRRRVLVAAVVVAVGLATGIESLGKLLFTRYRPFTEWAEVLAAGDWRALWGNVGFRLRPAALSAFPSGHTTSAFAFAGVLAWFYRRVAWVFWLLAAGCGISRVAEQAHWLGDCIAGGAIGYAASWVALRPYVWVLPGIWANRWRRRLTDRAGRRR